MSASLSPSAHGSNDDEFNRLALGLFGMQFETTLIYQRYCRGRGADPGDTRHWTEIPALPTDVFKEFDITSLEHEDRIVMFRSSGTSKSRSRHYHDAESLALYEDSILPWFSRSFLPANSVDAAMDLVVLTPSFAAAPESSLVYMFDSVSRRLPWSSVKLTAAADEEGAWELDAAATLAALQESSAAARPVAMLGTAFSFVHLLEHLQEAKTWVDLPRGSRALETGGYKGRARQMPKEELHESMRLYLNIEPSHVITEYGMSELSSQAYDRAVGAEKPRLFQFPPWARARVISPETLSEVPAGQVGLLQVYDLANMRSALAVQTGDVAIQRDGGFELLGRIDEHEPRGCSLMPAEPAA